jgi:hypothetical protein
MSRGPDGDRTRDIASARRRGSRRAAAARVRQEQRRRLRVIERKHASGFLSVAVKVARRSARDFGWKVHVERMEGARGRWGLPRWSVAVVQLVPSEISVRFALADNRGSNSSNAIGVYAGRKLVRPCPAQLLESGDRRAFAAWLGETLIVAAQRSRRP